MLNSLIVSILFHAVSTVVLTSGVLTLQGNHKAPANRAFFALTAAITIWSTSMALSTTSTSSVTCEIFRRISAIGWCTTYAILLHFILIITNKSSSKKLWFYLCLYLPALISLFAFAIPNKLNPTPYDLKQTKFGWINVARNNLWDWIFYTYYIGYTLIGLFLLYRWNRELSDPVTKKKSRIMSLSIIAALTLGTITDVILSSQFSELPQMAPVIMLIPVLSMYHICQRYRFNITDGIDKKTSYIALFTGVLTYIILSSLQVLPSYNSGLMSSFIPDETLLNGIIVQIKMFISLYLVLKENRPGYISAAMLNSLSLISAFILMIRLKTSEPLLGIISYIGILIIITLIKAYKEKNTAYIKKINTQAVKENFYSKVFNQAPVGIAIMRETEYIQNDELKDLNINPSYERILGRSKHELQNMNWAQITHPDDLTSDLEYFEQFKNGNTDIYSREKRYIKPDGSVVWVDMLISRFASIHEGPGDHVCIITDITERKKIEATLTYNSEHMLLTGLYNRRVLIKTLANDALMPCSSNRALVGVNLSAMHSLSLRYGYHYNQNILKSIASSLEAYCNDKYSLYNPYEYGFVFYVKDYEDLTEITDFNKKLSTTLSSYLYVHGIGVGIGILNLDDSAEDDANELLQKLMNTSEVALKSSKNNVNILFHNPELDLQITRENDISQEISEISKGMNTNRLFLQYQPIIDVMTNKICGFEALARLNSEKYGLVPPFEFIPIAEKNNMIAPFGDIILIKALRFLNRLKENGHDELSLTINISTIQILEDGFANKVIDLVNEMQLNPENVGIELTESVFSTERAEINTVINALKAARMKVLIDDFGTGYSSFARERDLNIDYLKIDKSFIDKLVEPSPKKAITRDIIKMAHKLGHRVVAEGVEYKEQLNFLRDHNCDRVQGYLISKPLDEDLALAFLLNNQLQMP